MWQRLRLLGISAPCLVRQTCPPPPPTRPDFFAATGLWDADEWINLLIQRRPQALADLQAEPFPIYYRLMTVEQTNAIVNQVTIAVLAVFAPAVVLAQGLLGAAHVLVQEEDAAAEAPMDVHDHAAPQQPPLAADNGDVMMPNQEAVDQHADP